VRICKETNVAYWSYCDIRPQSGKPQEFSERITGNSAETQTWYLSNTSLVLP